MVGRRTAYNPLEPATTPHWYVVRSMHGTIIESRQLSAGTNLKRAFIAAMLDLLDNGWSIGEFSSTSGTFFCNRSPDRRMVSIDPTDPHDVPMNSASHLGGCPTCGD
jgi:hypothetical protein